MLVSCGRAKAVSGMTYAQQVLAAGAVGYWRLGESSGTIAADVLGTHDGMYVGGPTLGQPSLLASDPNTAVVFGGTQNVTIPNTTTIALSEDFSLECWFKTTNSGQNTIFLGTWRQSDSFGHGIGQNGSNIRLLFNGGGALDVSAPQIHDGSPHHVVATYTAAGGGAVVPRLYLDGVLVGTNTPVTVSSAPVTCCIASAGDSSLKFTGTLDECVVYTGVLPPATVLAHYLAGVT